MTKGKFHFVPFTTSGIYDSQKIPLIIDFPEFSGHLNIEEFFQWLYELERFFEYKDIIERKKVKFVVRKPREVHGLGRRNCKECALG